MAPCRHRHLLLIPPARPRVRCRHCHLTISPEELDGGFCPECHARDGTRQYAFDPVAPEGDGGTHYLCEDCRERIEVMPVTAVEPGQGEHP